MGTSQSQPLARQLSDYKIIHKDNQNNMTFLSHVQTDKQYLLREHSYNDEGIYSQNMNAHKSRQTILDKNLTRLIRVEGKQEDHLCSNLYKIFAIWEYSYRSLQDQVHERMHQNRKFQQKQVQSILACCILGLSVLQKNKIKHQMITKKNVLLDSEGVLKIADPLACGSMTNLQVVYRNRNASGIYISPQQCQSLQSRAGYNPFKSDVWTLAMLVLQCGLLQNLSKCYKDQYQRIDYDMINQKLQQFGRQYGQHPKVILELMLKRDSTDRPDLIDLIHYTQKNTQVTSKNTNIASQLSPLSKIQQPSSYSVFPHSTFHNQPNNSKMIHEVNNSMRAPTYFPIANPGHINYNQNLNLNHNSIYVPSQPINTSKVVYNTPNVTFSSIPPKNLINSRVNNSLNIIVPQTSSVSPHKFVINNNLRPMNMGVSPVMMPQQYLTAYSVHKPTLQGSTLNNRSFQPLSRPPQNKSPSRSVSPSPNQSKLLSNSINTAYLPKEIDRFKSLNENSILNNGGSSTFPSRSYQNWKSSLNQKPQSPKFYNNIKFQPFKTDITKQTQLKLESKVNTSYSWLENKNSDNLYFNKQLNFHGTNANPTNTSTPTSSLTPRPVTSILSSLSNKIGTDSGSLFTSPQLLAYIGINQKFANNQTDYNKDLSSSQPLGLNRFQNNIVGSNPKTGSNTLAYQKSQFNVYENHVLNTPTPNNSTNKLQSQQISNNIQSIGQHVVTVQSNQKMSNSPENPNRVQKQNHHQYVNQPKQQVDKSNQHSRSASYNKQNQDNGGSNQKPEYVIETFKQGSRYEGQKLKDMRHGKGKFYYQDGGMYDGSWKMNKMDGFGSLFYQSGSLAYQGMWKQDQFQGKGKLFNQYPYKLQDAFNYQNFDQIDQFWEYYQGQFVEDYKKGKGILMLSNGQYFEGTFQNDMVQGPGTFYCQNGNIIKGIWQLNHLVTRQQ